MKDEFLRSGKMSWRSGGIRTHDTTRHNAPQTERPTTEQLSWLGSNLISHSTSDEQANYQLSMKEKAGVQVRLKEKGESPQALLSHLGAVRVVVEIAVRSLRVKVVSCLHAKLYYATRCGGHPNIPRPPNHAPLRCAPFNSLHIAHQKSVGNFFLNNLFLATQLLQNFNFFEFGIFISFFFAVNVETPQPLVRESVLKTMS